MHVKACKKTAKRRRAAAFGLRKDGVRLRLGCEKTVCGSISPAITRHGAAFGRWKDGMRLRLGGGKTAGGCVWAVERRQAAAFGRWKDGTELHLGDIAPAKNGMRHNVCGSRSFTTFPTSNGDAFPTARQNTFPCKKSTLHMEFYRYAMHYKIMVDFALREYFNREQFITEETVDAEITVVMPVQRIHGAEMWIRNKLSNGPLRA